MKRTAIILAAGRSERMAMAGNKTLLPLNGRPVLSHVLELWHKRADALILAINPTDQDAVSWLCAPYGEALTVVTGGTHRAASVANALAALPPSPDAEQELIAIQDAARPLTLEADIEAVFQAAQTTGAAILAGPVTDTVRHLHSPQQLGPVIPRELLVAAQTPQIFRRPLLLQAYAAADDVALAAATDDAALVQNLGAAVALVWATGANLKLTRPADLAVAESILKQREDGLCV